MILLWSETFANRIISSEKHETFFNFYYDMIEFYKNNHHYPKTWLESGEKFTCTKAWLGTNLPPKPHETKIWFPEGCDYHYELISNGKKHFTIRAFDRNNTQIFGFNEKYNFVKQQEECGKKLCPYPNM